MLNRLLRFLEKRGRKYAFTDFYGDVMFYRYYLFYDEEPYGAQGGFWPNAMIHVFPGDEEGEGPDAEHIHKHPYHSWSYILKGGYTEAVDEGRGVFERETISGHWVSVPFNVFHRIKQVIPDSVTIFMHGFRRGVWTLRIEPCKEVCDVCASNNDNNCYRSKQTTTLYDHLDSTSTREDEWRGVRWMKCGPSFSQEIEKRKRTLRRMGINTPSNMRLKRDALKLYEIKQSRN